MNTTYNGIINTEQARALEKWKLVRDCVNDRVEENNATQQYIVRDAHITDDAYKAFASRAVFTNYVGSTLDVLTGSANYKPYTLTGIDGGDLPESIDYIQDDFSGSNIGYSDHLKKRQRELFSVGRVGVWVNVEGNNQDRSQAEQVKATGKIFLAEQIEDWSEMVVNGKKQLNYLKLCEEYKVIKRQSNGEFNWEVYRVIYELYLDENGLYAFDVDDGSTEGSKKTFEPTLGNGQRLDWIPFQFYGSQDNTPSIDVAPMFKLSRINIGIYNSDANMRQATHLFSVPTATFSLDDNVSVDEFYKYNNLKKGQSPVFGGTAYVGCKIELAQMSLDNMLSDVISKDVEAMARIGAQMITVGQNETAEAARIRKSSGMANLADMVENLEQGDIKVIEWMMMFNNASGMPDEFTLKLNRTFYDDKITPQMMQQLVTMNIQGLYPTEDLFNVLQDNNLTEKSDAKEYIESLGQDISNNAIDPDAVNEPDNQNDEEESEI